MARYAAPTMRSRAACLAGVMPTTAPAEFMTRPHGRACRESGISRSSRRITPLTDPRAPIEASMASFTLVLDLRGCIRSCSPAAAQLFGIRAAAAIGRPVRALIPELPLRDDTPGYNLAFVAFRFSADEWATFDGVDGTGRRFGIEISIAQMTLDGRFGLVLELRQSSAEGAAQSELRRLIAAAEFSTEAVLITDTDGLIEYVNPAFELMTGFAPDEVVGQTPRILKSGALGADFYAQMWSTLRSGQEFNDHFLNRRKGGETFYAQESIRPFVDRFGTIVHYVATLRDVTAQMRAYERLDYLANYDPLTDLPNRNLFLDRLHQEVARATRACQCFAVLFIDVDGFKAINDHFGHATGDALLRTVGEHLKRCIRAEDTVARLGGDEFVMILVDVTNPDGLASVIDKVRLVGKHIALDDGGAAVSLSIGVATFPDDGDEEHQLLKAADRAMYLAKASRHRGDTWAAHPVKDTHERYVEATTPGATASFR